MKSQEPDTGIYMAPHNVVEWDLLPLPGTFPSTKEGGRDVWKRGFRYESAGYYKVWEYRVPLGKANLCYGNHQPVPRLLFR